MKQLLPFIIVIIFFIIIAVLMIALLNYRIKKRILDSGPLDESAVKALSQFSDHGMEALKWGLIFLSGGIGLVILEYLPYNASDSPLPYGVIIIFIAIGFLAYYSIAAAKKRR